MAVYKELSFFLLKVMEASLFDLFALML